MKFRSKEALGGAFALAAVLVCAPMLFSSSPPSWATKPEFETRERSANGTASSHHESESGGSGANDAALHKRTRERFTGSASMDTDSARGLSVRLLYLKALLHSDASEEFDAGSESETLESPVHGDWIHRTPESTLVDFCQRTTLRGVLLKSGTDETEPIRFANLNGLLVRENQELANGITVSEIGESYVELREGTFSRRLTLSKSALAPDGEELR